MKVYYAYFQEYEDTQVVGVFSSREKAEQALEHFYAEATKGGKYFYYDKNSRFIHELELDAYYNKHFSPLSKALE